METWQDLYNLGVDSLPYQPDQLCTAYAKHWALNYWTENGQNRKDDPSWRNHQGMQNFTFKLNVTQGMKFGMTLLIGNALEYSWKKGSKTHPS